jgi:hypothetical protein
VNESLKTYVAMHEPDTRIIGIDGNSQVSLRWQHSNISSKRIVKLQIFRHCSCKNRVCFLPKNEKVVSVEMNRMRVSTGVLDNPVIKLGQSLV